MASQLRGECEAKSEMMEQYLQMVRPLLAGFNNFEMTHIPRFENQMVDVLANLESNALYSCNVELSAMGHSSIPNAAVIAIDHQAEPS